MKIFILCLHKGNHFVLFYDKLQMSICRVNVWFKLTAAWITFIVFINATISFYLTCARTYFIFNVFGFTNFFNFFLIKYLFQIDLCLTFRQILSGNFWLSKFNFLFDSIKQSIIESFNIIHFIMFIFWFWIYIIN